ncbi:MerR family transcriptional regulator [Blautia sp. MSJ-36]|uniref:MerR family transcriptional regulator n=1 Tax=Blautia sp. MSJ-36 TaxID=2841530 RepID=UPI001C123CCC|nr:MerR family transcriptional regulator [Blautia sp. MSJ-36]MBU5447522.1 MerR family transcriptional regulator [Blautia sp. MSJ-36]
MQKFNDPCIKTGDFARLCGTNKRTLIHYDEIGLFKPAYTDDRGYRYYSESQFDVFFTINCLSKLGMPLREIGAFLNHRNPQALKKLLLEQREEVLKEEERIRKTRQVIETKLALVSLQEKLESNQAGSSTEHIFQEYTPEEYMILSDPLNTNDHEAIIHTLCSHIGYCSKNNLNAGHPYGAMLDVSELRQRHLDTYAYFFTKVIDRPEDFPFHIKPAGTYAVAYLKGDYYDSEETYRKLFQWIDENDFRTGQYSYKEAIIDELAADSSEEYLTKISVQIF